MSEELTWKYTGKSVLGTSHEKSGTPCQDACRMEIIDGLFVAVVADGSGSAKHSDIGSKIVAQTALDVVRGWHTSFEGSEKEWERIFLSLVETLRETLQRKAVQEKWKDKDLATTFLMVVVTDDSIAGMQIGDGAIVYGTAGTTHVQLLITPERSEYLNETVFLTSSQSPVQVAYVESVVDRVAIFSDGLQMLALNMKTDTPEPYQAFFQPFFYSLYSVEDDFEREKHLEAFLQSPRVCTRTDDDKTLVFANRRKLQNDNKPAPTAEVMSTDKELNKP